MLAMIFYDALADRALWRMSIIDLHFISTNPSVFPANMRRRATYWVNQKEGRHNHLPTDKQRNARKINWALCQLESMKAQLGSMPVQNATAPTLLAFFTKQAQQNIQAAINSIRLTNQQKTGKPPRSVQQELKYWREAEGGWPMPERLAMYLPKEKDNVKL